jgi:hypothetical protein
MGGPDPSLLPGADTYTAANNGVNNSSHNPHILGSGDAYSGGNFSGITVAQSTPTWVLNSTQITTNTTITAVRFYFGSLYDTSQEHDATIEIAPEPGPIVMVLGGLVLIAAGSWKRRNRQP